MNLAARLEKQARPYLEPDERVDAAFRVQSGPSPYWVFLSAWILLFAARNHLIVATDRAIVVLDSTMWMQPKRLRERYPRNVQLGPTSGLWGSVMLDNNKKYWVHRRFKKYVAAADAALAHGRGVASSAGIAAPAQAHQQLPPPQPPQAMPARPDQWTNRPLAPTGNGWPAPQRGPQQRPPQSAPPRHLQP
jgi:hypothetical protein